jgi:hypothetical protein
MERPCLRSGYCCKKATCAVGVAHGADPVGCKFLRGDNPGDFDCRLVSDNPDLGKALAIGAGCCSSLNSDRRMLLKVITSPAQS